MAESVPTPTTVVAIVDDDDAALESFGALLESGGFQTSLFRSCEAFLAAPDDGEAKCLVLDARFEGMSGLELLARMRTSGREMPTVFVMGWFDPNTRSRALRFPSVVDVLDKPVAATELFAAVRNAVAR